MTRIRVGAAVLNTSLVTGSEQTLLQTMGVHPYWTACLCCLMTMVAAAVAAGVASRTPDAGTEPVQST